MSDKSYCSVSKKCNGCQLSNMDYQRQLKYKQNEMRIRFNRLLNLEKITPSPLTLHYRNKAQFVFREDKDGKISPAIYQSSDRTAVKCRGCALHTEKQNAVGLEVARLMEKYRIKPYDMHRERGTLRSLILRESFESGNMMAVFVCDGRSKFGISEAFATELSGKFSYLKSIITTKSTSNKLTPGDNPKVLFGEEHLIDTLLSLRFVISYNSFFQINTRQTENLYSTAIDFASLTKEDTVLDAYSGTGTIGIIASEKAGKVISVEQNENAVKDAILNARLNNIENISFVCDDSERYMKKLEHEDAKITAAILDPPRAGCSKSFLMSLSRVAPQKIVYISCNIDTQLRDLRLLSKCGYKPLKAQGFDMFPYTRHIESVVLLEREHGASE